MFTGIITDLGKVSKKTSNTLIVTADRHFLLKLKIGDSISLNGICLTVVRTGKDYLEVNYLPETRLRTNIKYLKPTDPVNLELPATPTSFLGGHLIQGHVDGVGKLRSITNKSNSFILKFSVADNLSKYVVEKGSIAVNGISLTVNQVQNNYFTVDIIPHTWEKTSLHSLKIGDLVNIEVDILAKYLESLLKRKK